MGWVIRICLLWVALLGIAPGVPGGEAKIAVAANFHGTMRQLVTAFSARTTDRIVVISGSTGKHYAQIHNGAPFDALFAADSRRPRLLEEEGLIQPASRFTYARGQLVLWSPRADYVDDAGDVLRTGDFRYLALANPRLAPYGAAAEEVLRRLQLWDSMQDRLVRGENVGQALQFVVSGNAELGFVACSQVHEKGTGDTGSLWRVPIDLYAPIEQQAVLLTDNPVAKRFVDYVESVAAKQIIKASCYDLPDS